MARRRFWQSFSESVVDDVTPLMFVVVVAIIAILTAAFLLY